jgi:hypothetical protein
MTHADIYAGDFPHGTPAGFALGCRGATCANHATEWPTCKEANLRYQGDYMYRKRVDAGMTLAELRTADDRDAVIARRDVVVAERATPLVVEPATPTDVAIEYVLEAERSHGVRTYAIGEEQGAVLALRATSLAEYVCGVNLALTGRERERAADLATEAERRRPSGRKVHTAAESQEFRDDAARHLERADAAEAAALSAIGVSDLAAADLAVSHMIGPDAVSRAGSFEEEWDAALEVTKRVRARQDKQRRWSFVRGRAEQASQPRGGLLPLIFFDRYEFGGAPLTRRTESGNAGTIASAVELIARWDLAGDPRAGAEPSAAALEAIRGVRRGEHTESAIGRMASHFRTWGENWDELDELEWEEGEDDETLKHIAEMRARVSRCFERFGRPVQPGTWAVHSERFHLDGHIDFVTADTIWDLKVSDTVPGRSDVLQLLLYWVTLRDDPDNSLTIAYVGIYNPRLDTVWRIAVAEIPPDVVSSVESLALARASVTS